MLLMIPGTIWDNQWSNQKKNLVLFPVIGRVEIFLSLTRPHSRMRIRINIFNFKKNIKKQEDKNQKKLKKKREYPWRIWRDTVISFANMLRVFLTYLVESWISPGCSYEYNVVYVQREKSQYLLYYNDIWSTHFHEQK